MGACTSKSTTGLAGGCESSYTPAPQISTPSTSKEIPMKNQIETERCAIRGCLPENDVENYKHSCNYARPKNRFLVQRYVLYWRNLRLSVHQPSQFAVG